jgi:hypothetical protein
VKAVRLLLAGAGIGLAAYGGWLLVPQLPYAVTWLVAGPILHDAVVAPLVGLTGLALGRVLPGRAGRRWVAAGLAVTATLLLIAIPLLWRPHPAPPNPGLQDRDYPAELAAWLAVLWAGILLGATASHLRRRHRSRAGPASARKWADPGVPPSR